ncbi:signal recognition particle, SRP9/SRP14 subunit [Dipodascopsis uninucleata]
MAVPSRLSNQAFLIELEKLFGKQKEGGTVFLQQKRLIEPSSTAIPVTEDEVKEDNGNTYSLIFRATDGDSNKTTKAKISTIVGPKDLEAFWKKYLEIAKTGVSGLKKKDKKKQKGKKKSNTKGSSK